MQRVREHWGLLCDRCKEKAAVHYEELILCEYDLAKELTRDLFLAMSHLSKNQQEEIEATISQQLKRK